MVNKGKGVAGRRGTKRAQNPMYRQPIPRKGPKISFDGTTFNSVNLITSPLTAAGLASFVRYLSCDAPEGIGGGASTGVVGLYNEYKIPKCLIRWEPSVGPASVEAGARIHCAVLQNPEEMVAVRAVGDSTRLTYIRGMKSYRTWNAWERYTYHVPIEMRKKWFDTNENTNLADDNQLDRSCQQMVVFVIESIAPIASGHGNFRVEVSYICKTLSLVVST